MKKHTGIGVRFVAHETDEQLRDRREEDPEFGDHYVEIERPEPVTTTTAPFRRSREQRFKSQKKFIYQHSLERLREPSESYKKPAAPNVCGIHGWDFETPCPACLAEFKDR